MKILIIGSGAREHAIAKALHRSTQKPTLYCCATTYNPGIQSLCDDYWLGDLCSIEEILQNAKEWSVDFAIIGPEGPLEKGLVDALNKASIPAIGPEQKSAQIETSKSYARDLLKKYKVQGQIEYKKFNNLSGVHEYLHKLGENNYVIKADGLMSGKGVKVAGEHLLNFMDAYQYCQELFTKECSFVIEERLIGQEFSLLCFSDGTHVVPMPAIQDHKRAYVGNKGPNTGGMGSYTDANHLLPFLTQKDIDDAVSINTQCLKALQQETGEKYRGILYGGFMATMDGIRVIEFNARFGDPEALNVLSILESDFVSLCLAMLEGNLTQEKARFAPLATVCKYAVPEGYPDHPLKNTLVDISQVQDNEHLYIAALHMLDDRLFATGSRAAAIVGIGKTIAIAEQKAEADIKNIHGKLFHREDIGTAELIDLCIQQMQELRQKTAVSY